ncbi:Integral membrane protein OS=Streptomyces alboniger OX=132473 GN=CP975_24800 PE=4 SV=1 [Streptomyces alboniger]
MLLVVLGLTMWFQPHSRIFAGVAAILLALVSLVVSNFGGFVIGFLLALVGGALGVSWAAARPAGEPAKGRGAQGPGDPVDGGAPGAPAAAAAGGVSGTQDDLSGTSPTNGTNGRHRAG